MTMNYSHLIEHDTHPRALLSHLAEPGDVSVNHLIQQVGDMGALDLILGDHVPSNTSPLIEIRKRLLPRFAGRIKDTPMHLILHAYQRDFGIRFITPLDKEWPSGLNDLGQAAPLGLWVRGKVDELTFTNSVAIVGARAATSYGECTALMLAGELAGKGFTIVSGAAYGIDGAAHRAAIAAGGTTVAFVAGGVDRPYPVGHSALIDKIAETGAVISEMPPGSTPTKWRFLQRNRLIAAASQASVVVEAGWRSGSLNEASHAAAIGRPVGAVPGPITSPASAGCHRVISEGVAKLVTSSDEVIRLVG